MRNEVIKENKSCIFLENADDRERIPSLEVQKVDLEGQLSHLLERLGTIVHWNTKNVKDMSFTFAKGFAWELLGNDYGQEAETKAELHWDTSNVENMQGMFFENYALSEEIQEWVTHLNVSQVKDMSYMFFMSNFNKDINAWNVSRVENMEAMFADSAFNQPINNWNVQKVENMSKMFHSRVFNQPLDKWQVKSLKNMQGMFSESFLQNIDSWEIDRTQVKTADAFSPESPFLPKWYGEDTINDEELIAEVSSCFKFGLGCEADKVRFELPFKENNIKFFKGDKQGDFTHICLPYAEYSDEKRTKDIYKSIFVCLDSIKVPQAKTMILHFKDMRYQNWRMRG